MAVSQSLTLTEVPNSQNIANNTSQVRILWTSTQTGASWNGNTKTAYYYVSINGATGIEYSVSYTLPKNTTKTILDTIITVPHRDDGTAFIAVETVMYTGISAGTVKQLKNLTPTPIARASLPSCITFPENTKNVGYFGDTIAIHMNRKSTAFTHKVYYYFGTLTKKPIATGVTNYTYWSIPIELIDELTANAKEGLGSIYVETYTDNGTKYVGDSICQFIAKVPDIAATKPKVSMTLSPVGSLPSAFDGLYIQGLTKVKATLSASGEYGATISSYLMKVDGVSYNSSAAYTSGYLTSSLEKTVFGYATDSRGNTGETSQTIYVIPYNNPRLENSSAVRCDKNGNPSESGTYLKISGKRVYSPCTSNGEQKNFCEIQYRYSQDGGVSYSQWTPILNRTNISSDEVVTAPLLGGALSTQLSYMVHIRAIDDIGRYAESYISIPTEKVYWHRDGARNALGLGKYNERDNAVDSAWDFYMNGKKVTGLPTPTDDTDAVPLGLLGDYITERGTNGLWTYEKWASGKAECRATISSTQAYSGNSLYCQIYKAYPFEFAKLPIPYCSGMQFQKMESYITLTHTTNTHIEVFMKCGVTPSESYPCYFHVRVVGKLKELEEE